MAACRADAPGFETVLLETRHVKAALSAMTVKTDRKVRVGLHSCCGWDVPYRGVAPALTDLLGGQVQVTFDHALGDRIHEIRRAARARSNADQSCE
jgi:hypothetical protein